MIALTDSDILEFLAGNANVIVGKLNSARRDGPVTSAVELLLRRIVGAGNSLHVLRKHSPHDFAFDGAMILRGMYDAMLQALFILSDPEQRESRAGNYLDFRWVEKKDAIQVFDNSPTCFGQRISQSPRRVGAEPAIDREYARVCPKFKNAKGKDRDRWYKGSLRDLAKATDLESEYEILQKQLSGTVHSSAYALQEKSAYEGYVLMNLAWKFSFRVLGKFAEYAQVALDEHESELVSWSQLNSFDNFGDPSECQHRERGEKLSEMEETSPSGGI
jgi:hypothetical protein